MSKKIKNSNSQLPLDLPMPAGYRREDLIESKANEMALAMLDSWPDWPSRISVLAGPIGSGKSHIAGVWAEKAQARTSSCKELTKNLDEFIKLASIKGAFLLEDAGQGVIDETALFHLLNAVKQGEGYCLITSRSWPITWNVKLADLASRLKAVQLFEISEPDDILLKQVMMKQFSDRQLSVDQKVIEYCILRMERSLESVGRLVEAIDREALSNQAGITRTTASNALQCLGMK